MIQIQKIKETHVRAKCSFVYKALLEGGASTTVYVIRYERSAFVSRVVVFENPSPLLAWCKDHEISEAINGGYDLHHTGKLLGEYWTSGHRYEGEPITKPWASHRSGLYIGPNQTIKIAKRGDLPDVIDGDFMHAGPMLISSGQALIEDRLDPEGFSSSAEQFSPDPTVGRHPRAAIGYNEKYIWTVASDGRKVGEAGLALKELAIIMVELGVHRALNLDGGSSTQLISDQILLNDPRGQVDDHYPEGLPISSAIIFIDS